MNNTRNNAHTNFNSAFNDTTESKEHVLLEFKAQLAECRLRLIKQLGIASILDGGIREQVVQAFAQELEGVQYQFLRATTDLRKAIQGRVTKAEMDKGLNPGTGVAAGTAVAAGMAASNQAGVLVVDHLVTGMFWWKHIADVTLLAKIAALLGISLGHAAILVAIAAGFPVFLLTRKLTNPVIGRLLRRLIVASFDKRVEPELMAWARGQLGETEASA